jgi:hypothetical protein
LAVVSGQWFVVSGQLAVVGREIGEGGAEEEAELEVIVLGAGAEGNDEVEGGRRFGVQSSGFRVGRREFGVRSSGFRVRGWGGRQAEAWTTTGGSRSHGGRTTDDARRTTDY